MGVRCFSGRSLPDPRPDDPPGAPPGFPEELPAGLRLSFWAASRAAALITVKPQYFPDLDRGARWPCVCLDESTSLVPPGSLAMKAERSTYNLETADAVLLLEAPRRESPALTDVTRATCSYGLLLAIPAALIVTAFAFVTRLAAALPMFRVAW